MKRTLAPALLLLALLAACSNVETPDLEQQVRDEKIVPEAWTPIPLRVGLAPFRAELELVPERLNVEDTNRWVLAPDQQRLNGAEKGLHKQLLDVMNKYRMFERAEAVSGARPDSTQEQLRQLALAQGLDCVIVPVLRRQDVGHVESNGAYAWNMFIWWMVSPIISWFVADETFDANLHVELQVYPTTGTDPARMRRLEPREVIRRDLDDFDTGFNLLALYSTPGYMDEDNWLLVGDLLMPIAECEMQKQALRYFTGEFSRDINESLLLEELRRRPALIIGADQGGRPGLPLTRYAEQDAGALSRVLGQAKNAPLTDGAVRALTGVLATRENVLKQAEALAPLARFNDDLFLAFCGCGIVTAKNELGLVLAQPALAEGKGIEIVTLDELLDAACANRPRSLVLFLDCSFTAPGDPRCATPAAVAEKIPGRELGDKAQSLLARSIARLEEQGTSVIVLSATSARPAASEPERALELEDLAAGLFTSFAIEALTGRADANRDGSVTVEEFEKYVVARVTPVADLEGMNQRPFIRLPQDRKGYVLPCFRR